MTARLPDRDRSNAVLIGAADYTHASGALPALPQVHNNLIQLGAVLTDPQHGGFDARRTRLVLNPPDSRAVYDTLRRASADCSDTLLVYYAGHGLLDGPGRLHLALAGTDPEHPDASISALPITIVKQVLAESAAVHRILILDCCFSGRATDAFMGPAEEVALRQTELDGAIIIASAPPNEASLAIPGQPYTAFTGELIRLLRIGDGPAHPSDLQALFEGLVASAADHELPRPRWLSDLSRVDLALTCAADDATPHPAQPAAQVRKPPPPRTGGSGREPAQTQAHAPYFYLSYARTPRVDPDDEADPDRWTLKLFRDLSREVMEQSALPGHVQPGFMDRTMRVDGYSSREVGHALSTCRVFVPLYSPRYFASEFCGREWGAFARRPVEWSDGALFVVPIVPVWWIPMDRAKLPAVARAVRFDFYPRKSTDHRDHGLSMLARTKHFADEYEMAVLRLAKLIVSAAENVFTVPGHTEDVMSQPSAFIDDD